MKEIGGYIELDTFRGEMLHENAIALNCGRNALAYLIEAKNIKKIWLPYYLCSSVSNICRKYKLDVNFYHITPDFLPQIEILRENEWLYLVNYYGQLSRNSIISIKNRYKNLILDNSQDYFAEPIKGIDTIYTCRKYLGVPDGAFLYSNVQLENNFPVDESYERIHYILGRFERSASEFYKESVENNKFFASEPIKKMSKLTYNLLHAIDYEKAEKIRTQNFSYLLNELKNINKLEVKMVNGAFMYPLLIENSELIRKALLEHHIYIPILWPNVIEENPIDCIEYRYAKDILPIPIDQRYGIMDMRYIVEVIKNV